MNNDVKELMERRLLKAKRRDAEEINGGTSITTIRLEAPLHRTVQMIALKRKHQGKEPTTVTGIIKEALQEFVERNKDDI